MFDGLRSSLGSVVQKMRGGGRLTEDNLNDAVRMVRRALMDADVNINVAKEFCDEVKKAALGQELIGKIKPDEQFVKVVYDEMVALMTPPPDDKGIVFSGNPTVIMMVGLNGAGKTTTTGKLALWLKKKGKHPLLVAADLARPAAIEQLKTVGDGIGVPVHTAEDAKKTNPPDVCKAGIQRAKKEGHDVVILDTAGRMQIDEELMAELELVKKKVKPDYTLLVVDGMLGQDAANSAKVFHDRLDAQGLIVTKLDGDARGGAVLSALRVTGKPIRFIGTGEKPSDITEFRPESIADRILGMGDIRQLVEEAQQVFDQEEAEKQMEKMFFEEFTLEDFLGMLSKLEQMGSIKRVMKMMPSGMLGITDEMLEQFDEKEIFVTRAIIQSMTPRERRKPDVLDANRKRRIARGSGTSVQQINDVLKGYKQMRDQFKSMKSQGFMGKLAHGQIMKQKKKTLKEEKKNKRRVLKRK